MTRARALEVFLRLARLPTLPPPVVEPGFDEAADALLRGERVDLPEARLDFLRWLGESRGVVFHGSPRNDLVELSTERKSRDSTEWGNQQAVYASSDPVWSIYFAVLRRDNGWQGTRNGSMGVGGRRFYFFLHNRGSQSPDRFGPGSLYILPSETFGRRAVAGRHRAPRLARPGQAVGPDRRDTRGFPVLRPDRLLP